MIRKKKRKHEDASRRRHDVGRMTNQEIDVNKTPEVSCSDFGCHPLKKGRGAYTFFSKLSCNQSCHGAGSCGDRDRKSATVPFWNTGRTAARAARDRVRQLLLTPPSST